jgi:hypothetical protein
VGSHNASRFLQALKISSRLLKKVKPLDFVSLHSPALALAGSGGAFVVKGTSACTLMHSTPLEGIGL